MTDSALTLELEGLGPVLDFRRFDLPASGFVQLEGLNGSGKSTTLEALQAVVGGDASGLRHSVEVPDGYVQLSRAGETIRLTLGHRNRREGGLVVHGLSGDVDPSQIVDPGILDPEAADLERARHVCAMAGLPAGLTLFESLLPAGRVQALTGQQVAKARAARSLPESGKWLKLALEDHARLAEQARAGLLERARGVATHTEGVDLTAPCDEAALAAATEAAVRALAEAEGERRAAGRRRDAIAAAQRTLDEAARGAGGLTVEEAQARVARAEEDLLGTTDTVAGLDDEVASAAQRVAELRARLAAEEVVLQATRDRRAVAGRDLTAREQALATARADVERARAGQDQLAALRAQVAQGAGDPGPTDETLAALRAAVEEARRAGDRGVLVRQARAKQAEAEALVLQSAPYEAQAAELRAAADRVWDVVADAVTRAAPEGVRFRHGRLVCEHPERGTVFFSELSAGERWRKVLPGCIRAVGRGGLLVVCQEGCEALDPVNTQYIRELAETEGVLVVGARASEGELRAEEVA